MSGPKGELPGTPPRKLQAAPPPSPPRWRAVDGGVTAEQLARRFHETYERLAPSYGYKTREASAVPWDDVPAANRSLMIAVCAELLGHHLTEVVT